MKCEKITVRLPETAIATRRTGVVGFNLITLVCLCTYEAEFEIMKNLPFSVLLIKFEILS